MALNIDVMSMKRWCCVDLAPTYPASRSDSSPGWLFLVLFWQLMTVHCRKVRKIRRESKVPPFQFYKEAYFVRWNNIFFSEGGLKSKYSFVPQWQKLQKALKIRGDLKTLSCNFQNKNEVIFILMWEMKSVLPLPVLNMSCCNISALFQTFFGHNDDWIFILYEQ